MVLVGETTTNAAVADLRKMLSKLDPKLFESSPSSPSLSSEKVAKNELAEQMAREQVRARGA